MTDTLETEDAMQQHGEAPDVAAQGRRQPDSVADIVKAVRGAVAEHGAPNSFAPGELSAFHTNLSPMAIGRDAPYAVTALRARGYVVEYSRRRFIVTSAPEGDA